MFYLFIGSTELSKVPGVSAAGANPEVTPYTAPGDADLIRFGRSKVSPGLLLDPQGHPTPAVVTRAAVIEASIPVTIVQAGSWVAPSPPYIELGAKPAADSRKGPALPDAPVIMENAKVLAKNMGQKPPLVMVGESVPGGTTTALLILRALGYREMVSSAGPENPAALKESIWRDSSVRAGIVPGALAKDPLRALTEFGDPMQAAVSAFVLAMPEDVEVVLAGGTQMLAVAALIKAMGAAKLPMVATTKYVHNDKNADFAGLAKSIGVKTWIANLNFSGSPHQGLAEYEAGFVKEGVGAGGSVYYAERMGVSLERVIARTNDVYRDMIAGK
ncbi:nicotinate-nucleotide--dimethylbenzimidazole phosphoribosyltransferase [Spirochaetia bacterium]|nr:nicotinate-nucleotide--dimethylbenzimidazole phosphoribosyltransferase [Spirochaetia bacterium]